MRKIYTILTVSITLLIASCGSEDKRSVSDILPAINVKVNQVESNSNSPFLSVSGKIQANNSADLSTRMMGYVNNIPVKVGDKVSKGQLLISINSADITAQKGQVEASIIEATAAFNIAEKDYNRYLALFSDNSASQKELDDMSAHFELAKARLESAKQMKNEINSQFVYVNIRAPFNGIVTNKFIEQGDMANPGMPLIAIETPGSCKVVDMVSESAISQIKKIQ